MKPIYPITCFHNVIDEYTDKNLYDYIQTINHINIGEVNSVSEARVRVPMSYRHKGLYVTYIINDEIHTDVFVGINNIDDVSIIEDSVWRQTSITYI